MCQILIFIENNKNIFFIFLPFLCIFSTLPSTQNIKVIGLIFFFELAIKNWAMNISTLYLFSKAFLGGAKRPPPGCT